MLYVQRVKDAERGLVPYAEPVPPWVRVENCKEVWVYDLFVLRLARSVELRAVLPFYAGGGPETILRVLRTVSPGHVVIWFNIVFDLRHECNTEKEYHGMLATVLHLLQDQHVVLWPALSVCNYWADKARYVQGILEGEDRPLEMLQTWPVPDSLSLKEKVATLHMALQTLSGLLYKAGYTGRCEGVVEVSADEGHEQVVALMERGGGLLQQYEERVSKGWEYRVYLDPRTGTVLWTLRGQWNITGEHLTLETVGKSKEVDAVEQAAVEMTKWLCERLNGQLPVVLRLDIFAYKQGWDLQLRLNECEYLGNSAMVLMPERAAEKIHALLLHSLLDDCKKVQIELPEARFSPLLLVGPRMMGIRNPDSVLCHMIAAVQVFIRAVVSMGTLFDGSALEEADSEQNKGIVTLLQDVATVSDIDTQQHS